MLPKNSFTLSCVLISILSISTEILAAPPTDGGSVEAQPQANTATSTTAAITNSLVTILTSQLGISAEQANTGVNAILALAQQQLSSGDYNRLLTSIPDLNAIAHTAAPNANTPDAGITGTLLKHVGAWMGTPNLGHMAQLAQTFSGLGLTTETTGKFLKLTLDYVQSIGGADLMGLLAGVLK
ncbi:hypothetical protein TI04_09980 [Achromatium sp. WMS2]|nr:hypothetical protein TI04_09980 [Achromatium sp. WMS2]